MKTKQVKLKQDEQNEVPTEVLASSIVAISEGIKKLRAGRLNEKALVLLIQHAAPNVGGRMGQSKVGTTEIRAVLEGLENLESAFLKKNPARV